MQAVLAVVHIDTVGRLLGVFLEVLLQPLREEHAVRVNLHSPRVEYVTAIVDNLLPHRQEDVCVQGRHKHTSDLALEVTVYNACLKSRS